MTQPSLQAAAIAPNAVTAPLEFLQYLYAAAVRRALPLHTVGAFLPFPPKDHVQNSV